MQPIDDRALELLVELGLLTADDTVSVKTLAGGVSSDIAVVQAEKGSFCVKFALAQLKVAAVWTAPVTRNAADYAWLEYVARFAPASVPRLYGQSARLGGFAMEFLDPERYVNWKTELMAGRVDPGFAATVGAAMAGVHSHSAADPAGRSAFDNKADFADLRLKPYFEHAALAHPDLAPILREIIAGQTAARIALVHGDVSPKNILMGPDGPVFLDAECAVEGDPAFDIAFCLNHLLIKTIAAMAPPGQLAQAARRLWEAYLQDVDWEPKRALERRVAELLPALMLARVDGKSPVEYLDSARRDQLRALARDLLRASPRSVDAIISSVQDKGARPSC